MELIEHYFADFTPAQKEQFAALGPLYREWNEQINVISRKDIGNFYERHVLHSLAIAAVCNFSPGARVLDIGTGGGFPGIPLAIFFPEVQFTLVDSIGKKIKVVQAVAEAIDLQNVQAFHSRVEDLKVPEFDFAVSRAVAPLGTLWQWAKPHLRVGRQSAEYGNGLICLKGGDLVQEFAESGVKPRVLPLPRVFDEPAFEDKVLIYVPR
ncbi:MAG: 16S rRNA (guanine(527)-N(7))-methyltransferase RsmG [Sphingobacteriales bacterium]|nr:MAG: 16S rRNA (guanine(527)-N(7))-methyltransferase RsmG [Sphingobacteriales bacterium]